MLIDQHESVVNTKTSENPDDRISNQSDKNAMTDVEATEHDVRKATDQLQENSASGTGTTPAVCFKKTKIDNSKAGGVAIETKPRQAAQRKP